jgi:hypothetical protein
MTMIGEISRRDKQGLKGRSKIIYSTCPECGKSRWVPIERPNQLCNFCFCKNHSQPIACHSKHPNQAKKQTGPGNHQWKGGTYLQSNGYIYELATNSPYINMSNKDGYILQHRLRMAEKLHRGLSIQEKVHHINGIKTDNRVENLELISQADHNTYKQMCAYCELRKEIKLLRWELKELKSQLQGNLV